MLEEGPYPPIYDNHLYYLPSPFSNFVQPPSSFLLNDIMDLNLSSLGTLVMAAYCCAFYATRHQTYCTDDILFASTLI